MYIFIYFCKYSLLFRSHLGSGSSLTGATPVLPPLPQHLQAQHHHHHHHHHHHQQQQQLLQHHQQQSDTSSSGSARDTPPAQRPLPALPVSPPPPQLPPRERLANGSSNCGSITSSGSNHPLWMNNTEGVGGSGGVNSGGGGFPYPPPPTTNLDDEWDVNDVSDAMSHLKPCEFMTCCFDMLL